MIHIFNWEIIGDRRSSTPKYIIYANGQPDGHIMDWAGCNYRRMKIPDQPKFYSIKNAIAWAKKWYENKEYPIDGNGSHIPDYDDQFAERVIVEKTKDNRKMWMAGDEMTMDEWDDYRSGF